MVLLVSTALRRGVSGGARTLLHEVKGTFRETPVNNSSSSSCSISRASLSRQLTSSLYFSTQPTEGGSDGKPNGNTAASGPIGGGDVVIGTKASQEGAPGVRQERRRVGGSGTRNSGNISGGRKLAGAMGLKEFMHRKRVLELYRGILKRARTLGDVDITNEARRQFRIGKDETEPLKIKMLLADGMNYLEAMQGSSRGGAQPGASWLDIVDLEDERGRVGQGFPWER